MPAAAAAVSLSLCKATIALLLAGPVSVTAIADLVGDVHVLGTPWQRGGNVNRHRQLPTITRRPTRGVAPRRLSFHWWRGGVRLISNDRHVACRCTVDEVGALVFDIGSRCTKAGFAGEDTPKVRGHTGRANCYENSILLFYYYYDCSPKAVNLVRCILGPAWPAPQHTDACSWIRHSTRPLATANPHLSQTARRGRRSRPGRSGNRLA